MPLPFASSSKKITLTRTQLRVLSVICAVVTVTGFAGSLSNAPQIEILQDIICQQHYAEKTSLSGVDCKVESVQARLAYVQAWKGTFDVIPGLILAISYGKRADRTGRKDVLFLSLLGMSIEGFLVRVICWSPNVFPLSLIYLTPLAQMIGGGIPVYMSMLFATISDSVPAALRTTAFSFVTSTFMLTHILGPSAAAAMMESKGPWLPYHIAMLCMLASFLIMRFLPETMKQTRTVETAPSAGNSGNAFRNDQGVRSWIGQLHDKTLRSNQFFRGNNSRSICLLLLAFFLESFGKASSMLMTIYVSKRFYWTIAKASYSGALRSMINLVLLLAILPVITYQVTNRFRLPILNTELRLTQMSALLLVLSSLIIGLSDDTSTLMFGIILNGLGSSYDLTARNILTSLVSQAHVAQVYSTMSVVVTLGILLANPLLAASFKWGMSLGGAWQGLPYHVAGLFAFLSLIVTMFVKLPDSETHDRSVPLENGISRHSAEIAHEGQYHDEPV